MSLLALQMVGNLFDKGNQIKNWLTQCAQIITALGERMCWITPMGLPVMQPYIKHSEKQMIHTIFQTISFEVDEDLCEVDRVKQISAFPPNFIHSLDSCHLMMTAEKMSEWGLRFAAVHDSFWTHPGDVDRMNIILRE